MKPALVAGARYEIHAQNFASKGDPSRQKYSRHASVRGVLIQPDKQVNGVIALIHFVGLVRLVGASHPINQLKKPAK